MTRALLRDLLSGKSRQKSSASPPQRSSCALWSQRAVTARLIPAILTAARAPGRSRTAEPEATTARRGSTRVMDPPEPEGLAVTAVVETEAVDSFGDAADDPAILVNPEEPEKSLVLGSDKTVGGGIYAYELDGTVHHSSWRTARSTTSIFARGSRSGAKRSRSSPGPTHRSYPRDLRARRGVARRSWTSPARPGNRHGEKTTRPTASPARSRASSATSSRPSSVASSSIACSRARAKSTRARGGALAAVSTRRVRRGRRARKLVHRGGGDRRVEVRGRAGRRGAW